MTEIKLLDHGYVRLVESWGSDRLVIESARMSTDGKFHDWEKDSKLLRYLYTNKHMTPFEMGGLIIEVKAPIFVFREWMRHRSQSFNELSARYTPLPNENYLPSRDRITWASRNPTSNKQAQGSQKITDDDAALWYNRLEFLYDHAQEVYEQGLSLGVPKELARLVVPVGRYSKMRASANLRNWLGFLELRMASNAQWEIREYANSVATLIEEVFPRTYDLFSEDKL